MLKYWSYESPSTPKILQVWCRLAPKCVNDSTSMQYRFSATSEIWGQKYNLVQSSDMSFGNSASIFKLSYLALKWHEVRQFECRQKHYREMEFTADTWIFLIDFLILHNLALAIMESLLKHHMPFTVRKAAIPRVPLDFGAWCSWNPKPLVF